MDLERARYNMVEQQVRTWEVLDQAVLDLMITLPRDRFVPEAYQRVAYPTRACPCPRDSS